MENQVQTVARDQQHLANQLIRNGVYQVESSAKQLQITQTVQTLAANAMASKGINDVNIKIDEFIKSIRPFQFKIHMSRTHSRNIRKLRFAKIVSIWR